MRRLKRKRNSGRSDRLRSRREPPNLITRQKDEDDKYTDFRYDVWGNQTWRNERNTEGSGDQIWNITYNAFGQPVKEEKNDGTSGVYEYNGRGLLTKKTDPKGIVLTNEYDECGRLISELHTFAGKSEMKNYSYDKNGFMYLASDNGVVSKINYADGSYKANAYDLVTSLETSVAGKKLNSSYSYDDALNMTELSYPDGTKTGYSYNALGQLTGISGGSTKYARNGSYDSLGRLLSLTAGNGKETTRNWNTTAGTLSGYNWGLDKYVARSLEWNNLGNITSISKGTSQRPYTNTYQYDNVGRLTYEHNGAESEVSTKESKKTNFLYIHNDVSGKNKVSSLYDYVSQIIKLDYYAGSAIVDLEAVQKLTSLKVFARNNRIKPEHLEVWLGNDGENWSHDESVTWKNDSEGWKVIFSEGTESRYVKLHSLWDERDEDYLPVDKATYSGNIWNLFEVSYIADGKENNYTYDARGNRLNEIEAYTGSNGRLTDYEYYANSDLIKRAGNWYFNYDRNGNLISRGTMVAVSNGPDFSAWTFSQTAGELWTYEYDLQNRMIKASYSGKGSANLKERGSYVYDYRGLLVKKRYQNYTPSDLVEVENGESGSEITEFYEYTADGRVIYNESTEDSTTKKTTYIWANTTLWCEVNAGMVYYHHTDHLGTTEVITDESGNVVWEAGYEAFGSILNERGETKFTPSYTGKFFDKASGLYYFNARWYDSELGKFTVSDPIRDGVNWWNYCNENPLSFFDFNGLEDISIREINKAYWRGIKDGFVDIGKNAWNTVRHPIQTVKEDFNRIAHPIKTTKATIQNIKDYMNSDVYTMSYGLGRMASVAVLRQVGSEAVGAYSGLSSGGISKNIGPKQLALPAPESKLALPVPNNTFALPPPFIETPYGYAKQSGLPSALKLRNDVENGIPLFRGGTMGRSAAGEGQFWSLENPLSENYADKMGIPMENYKYPDFVECGTLVPGTNFVIRPAPRVGNNKGGGIEVVVPPNGVKLNSFNTLETK